MFSSFLIRLTMLAVTMGAVCWIGWAVPQSRYNDTAAVRGAVMQEREGNMPQSSVPQTAEASIQAPNLLKGQQATTVSSRATSVTLDLNRATEQEIEALPGIGPVLAGRIVDYRQSRGAFRTIEQLRHVKGIGKKTFERIRTRVHVAPVSSPARVGRKTT